jgi:pyruvate dehydrogenase E1 component beta subunit
VAREGSDVTVVAYLKTVDEALAAAELLEAEGVSLEVLDPRTLVPFDREALRTSLEKTGRLVVAHEAPSRGGFGAEIAAIAAEECWEFLRAPIVRVCGANTPMPYAPELENAVIPDAARIAAAARSLVETRVA